MVCFPVSLTVLCMVLEEQTGCVPLPSCSEVLCAHLGAYPPGPVSTQAKSMLIAQQQSEQSIVVLMSQMEQVQKADVSGGNSFVRGCTVCV